VDAEAVLRWIRHRGETEFTTRKLCRSKDWEADRVRAALHTLERYGWVRPVEFPEGWRGRPTEAWEVYPVLPDRT